MLTTAAIIFMGIMWLENRRPTEEIQICFASLSSYCNLPETPEY